MGPQPPLLPDDVWDELAPLLATEAVRTTGRPRVSDRRCFEALLWVSWHCAPWKQLPTTYGSVVTVWRRLRLWRSSGRLRAALKHYVECAERGLHVPRWPGEGLATLRRHGTESQPQSGVARISGKKPRPTVLK